MVAVAAQIESLSEFHWPGYYLTAHSSILLLLVIIVFNERWVDVTRETANQMKFKDRLVKNLKMPSVPHYVSFNDNAGIDLIVPLVLFLLKQVLTVIVHFCATLFHVWMEFLNIGSITESDFIRSVWIKCSKHFLRVRWSSINLCCFYYNHVSQ